MQSIHEVSDKDLSLYPNYYGTQYQILMTYWDAQNLLERYSYYVQRRLRNQKLKYQLVAKIDKIRSYVKDYKKVQKDEKWKKYISNLGTALYKKNIKFADLREMVDEISALMLFLGLTNVEKDSDMDFSKLHSK